MSEHQDHREVLATVDKRGNRLWVYATFVTGYFRKRRMLATGILMTFYLLMPWIQIRGEQGILLDFWQRKFVFFGSVFLATDTIFLFFVLAISALLLFFFTAVLGRVWCGWACPETVFLEFMFRPIERWIEGDHLARRRLDAAPWNIEKIRKKALKHGLSAFISWIISSTFLAYFVGQEALIQMMMAPPWENWPTFIMTLVLMGFMAFQFGWFREQFCTVVCPYGRFQSVMLDRQSLVIGYDAKRGENRGKLTKKRKEETGDCIDCGKCVKVCPTGIDIRNGLQMECINCTACIDACDSVMGKIDRPLGLIRYASQAELEGDKPKLLRPRVIVYAVILVLMGAVLTNRLSTRELHDFQVIRNVGDRPYQRLSDNEYSNTFKIKIANKDRGDHNYQISLFNPPAGTSLKVPINPFPVAANSKQTIPLFVQFSPTSLVNGRLKLTVVVSTKEGYHNDQEITVLGPGK